MVEATLKKTLLAPDGPMVLSVDFSVEPGGVVSIFGDSGAGKTTILRMLAGLTEPDAGTIRVGGEVWYDGERGFSLPARKRSVGLVFQEYALFPNMTVRKNLEFALAGTGQREEIDRLLALTGLAELAHRKPDTLSGGQRQRVALARALARKPKLLLLDEPLSALDVDTRQRLQDEFLTLHREFGTTTLLVTHELSEVFKLSHRVYVIERGRIVKSGTPEEVFLRDRLSGKFKFVGEVLSIRKDDVVYVITALIGNTAVNVVVGPEDIEGLAIGDRVLVFSKAFQPILLKL